MLVIFQHTSRKWVLEFFWEAGVKGHLNLILWDFLFWRISLWSNYSGTLLMFFFSTYLSTLSALSKFYLSIYRFIIKKNLMWKCHINVNRRTQHIQFLQQGLCSSALCYFEDQTWSQMTLRPQPVNSTCSYNWNHLHLSKMKWALLRAISLFTTCIISAGCTSQRLFLSYTRRKKNHHHALQLFTLKRQNTKM